MDFLRIHPFMDGDRHTSRLLTAPLLYQEGFDICRHVSLETKIRSDLDGYYDALEESEDKGFENKSIYEPFVEYFKAYSSCPIASTIADWPHRYLSEANRTS